MQNLFKKLFVTALIVSNVVLGILYARVDAQYKMYKEFTEKGVKVQHQVPCTLPPLT